MKLLLANSYKSHLDFKACGGAERTLFHIRQELINLGCSVDVVCKSHSTNLENIHVYKDNEQNIDIESQKRRYESFILEFVSNYDMVVAFNFPELFNYNTKTPILCWYFNEENRWISEIQVTSSYHVAFPAFWMRDDFIKKHPNFPLIQQHILPLGVDINLFSPCSSNTLNSLCHKNLVVMAASVWHEGKGIIDFLDTCALLEHQNIPYEGLLVGGTTLWQFGNTQEVYYPKIEQRNFEQRILKKLSILQNTKNIGVYSFEKMPELYQQIDLFVLLSTWREAFPVSLLESLACGVPVIATNLGGNKEIVIHNCNGFLVPPNSPTTTADLISKLSLNLNVLQDLKQHARASILQLSWKNIAARLFTLLKNICNQ